MNRNMHLCVGDEDLNSVALLATIPKKKYLCCLRGTISFTGNQAISSSIEAYQRQIFKCRSLISSVLDVIASPVLGATENIYIIVNNEHYLSGKLKPHLKRIAIQVEDPIPLTNAIYEACLRYTILARLAPSWNQVEKYLVHGRDFLTSSAPFDAVEMDIVINETDTHVVLRPLRLRLPQVCAQDFLSSPHDFPFSWDLSSDSSIVRVLPSLNKAQVLMVSDHIPQNSLFKSYKELKRHWKYLYGYRLPESDEGVIYLTVRSTESLTCPIMCVRAHRPVSLRHHEPKKLLKNLLADLRARIPLICSLPYGMAVRFAVPKWNVLSEVVARISSSESSPVKQNGEVESPTEESVKKAPTKKKLTVEKIYQKKSQLEHILLHPDTYIGSVEPVTETMWVFDSDFDAMTQKEITYVPGLYKIFDEILVNAADNKQRDRKMDCIKITIEPENNTVSVWNNGKGIPVVEHKDEKMFIPTMIFGHLLTSSNDNDEEQKVTGGRIGFGAKLCNIFSTKFTVETSSSEYKLCFKQTWRNNMSKASEARVKPISRDDEDYTKVTFSPDLSKFKMEKLDEGNVALMTWRAYDVAASTCDFKVFLNGKRLPKKIKEEPVDKDEFDLMADDQKTLNEKLGNSPDLIDKKFKAAKKDIKQARTKAKGSLKKKGRNPWSDFEDDGSFSSGSDFDMGSSPTKLTPVRTTARRSAAEKVKFSFDEENSSEDEELELKDNEAVLNADGMKQEIDDDLDDGSFHSDNFVPESDSEEDKPKKKGGRKKKASSDEEIESKKPKKAPAKPRKKKEENGEKKAKPKAASKPKKVKAASSEDSDSDFGVKKTTPRVEEDTDALFDSLLQSSTPPNKNVLDLSGSEINSPVRKSKLEEDTDALFDSLLQSSTPPNKNVLDLSGSEINSPVRKSKLEEDTDALFDSLLQSSTPPNKNVLDLSGSEINSPVRKSKLEEDTDALFDSLLQSSTPPNKNVLDLSGSEINSPVRKSKPEKVKFSFDEENSSEDEELELKDNEAVLNADGMKQEIDDDLDDGSFHSNLAAKAKELLGEKLPKNADKEAGNNDKKSDKEEKKLSDMEDKKHVLNSDSSQDSKQPPNNEVRRVSPLMNMFMSRLVTPELAKSPSVNGSTPRRRSQSQDSDSPLDNTQADKPGVSGEIIVKPVFGKAHVSQPHNTFHTNKSIQHSIGPKKIKPSPIFNPGPARKPMKEEKTPLQLSEIGNKKVRNRPKVQEVDEKVLKLLAMIKDGLRHFNKSSLIAYLRSKGVSCKVKDLKSEIKAKVNAHFKLLPLPTTTSTPQLDHIQADKEQNSLPSQEFGVNLSN